MQLTRKIFNHVAQRDVKRRGDFRLCPVWVQENGSHDICYASPLAWSQDLPVPGRVDY